MIKFPHYTQLDNMDCGPTCLRMIAKYFGRAIPIQLLRDKCQISKEGTSLLGIAQAAEEIGFRSISVKIEFSVLTDEVSLPCIIHWRQNHYVVLYAIRKPRHWFSIFKWGNRRQKIIATQDDRSSSLAFLTEQKRQEKLTENLTIPRGSAIFYVADPAKGLTSFSTEEFCKNWLGSHQNGISTGVALLLETTPVFYEQKDELPVSYGFAQVLSYFQQYKQLILQLILGLVVASGLQLMFPLLTQATVDVGINTQNIPFLYLILGAQVSLLLSRLTVEFVRSWILLYISSRINLAILSDFFIKLMRLPVSFFDTKQFGDLMQRVNDHHRIEAFLTGQSLLTLFSLFNLFVLGGILLLYDGYIFLIFLGSSLLYIGWIKLFMRKRRQLDFKRFEVSSRSQSTLIQLIQGMQEIKLAGAELPMRWGWENIQVRLFGLQMKALRLSQFQQAGSFILNEGKNVFITFLAAQAVIQGKLTLGAMLALQYVIGQMNGPIEQLVGFIQGLQDAKISVERLNEIHSLPDEESHLDFHDQPLKISEETLVNVSQESIYLHSVSFKYPGAGLLPVMDNVSFSIPAGKTTAIVGMSGSGKTTLLKILLKFYAPTSGTVQIGSTQLNHINNSVWRQQCGVVMQDGFIFSDTIARNIAVGVEFIDASKLTHAVHVANLSSFIESLPLGLHTKIGADGSGISQGQRQRILIARTVYKNPRFILFDEATNALDANNESLIWDRLQDFFRNRTVIIVAHRLSTVSQADQIVVLSKGRVEEKGSHSSLLAQKGEYWKLVKNQLELGV